MTVGRVAKRAGVNVETLRYYERRRLLPIPPRSAGNYRLYSEETVRRLRFIKRAHDLGFTLEEIRELLALRAAPRARCATVRRQAEEKVKDIEEKMETLKGMRTALRQLIAACAGQGSVSECPILDALNQPAKNGQRIARSAGADEEDPS